MKDLHSIKQLFHLSANPVILIAADGTILFQNAVSEKLNAREIITAFISDLKEDNSASQEVTIGEKQFLFTATVVENDFLISATDITKICKDRDFYKEALDNLPADIGVFDIDGKYMYVNPAGIKDPELRNWIIGKTDFDYSRYRGKDTTMPDIRNALLKKVLQTKTEQGYEEEIKRPGQETDWQMRKLSPVFDDKGEVKFFLAYGINIKERKKAEIAQKEAFEIVERSAKAKEEFVAVMSHEIRTPMNAIIGMSRLLAKSNLDKTQTEYLDAILAASGNLIVIVNDILDFSKIEAGKLRLEHTGFSFNEVIEYASAVTRQQAIDKGLSLTFTLDENVSGILIGDVYRINQVIVNLLNNAIKFTHKGKVSVDVSLEKDEPDRQKVIISIIDTGIGMTKSFMEEMFTMYSQEVGVTRKYGGTGLGLKITSELVELMNGDIEVKSEKNIGSSIKVSLTLAKGTVQDVTPIDEFEYSEKALEGKKILIAEDNHLNVLVASTVLQNYGAAVVIAENGQLALDVLDHQKDIDVILMDVEMPVMDGIEATIEIRRKISKTLPVIALTANVLPDDKKKLLSVGMNGFISKPFVEAELIGTILKSLR